MKKIEVILNKKFSVTLLNPRPLKECPKGYCRLGIFEHNLGNLYNPSWLVLYTYGKNITSKNLRYEIYRDGCFWPYYGKLIPSKSFIEYLHTRYNTTSIKNVDLINFLDKINPDYKEYLAESDYRSIKCFNNLFDILDDRGAFDREIIYYENAINYLRDNDPSFVDSLNIANEFGYKLTDLDCEKLASLHASNKAREDFLELEDEINKLLKNKKFRKHQ